MDASRKSMLLKKKKIDVIIPISKKKYKKSRDLTPADLLEETYRTNIIIYYIGNNFEHI